MIRRWLAFAVAAVLFFAVSERSELAGAPFGILALAALVYAMSGASWARKAHLTDGHKEGEVVPKDFRVVTTAEHEPIERPWPKAGLISSLDEPERLTRYVSKQLGPVVLQTAGLVVYRDTEVEAGQAASDIHSLLDPIFPEPVQTRVERWNADLDAWQPPELAGGDKAALAALRWETRLTFADKESARAAAGRIRATGEVMVARSGRQVTVATVDESAARAVPIAYPALGGAQIRVRRLNPVSRSRLRAHLHDRYVDHGGWLRYHEPAAA